MRISKEFSLSSEPEIFWRDTLEDFRAIILHKRANEEYNSPSGEKIPGAEYFNDTVTVKIDGYGEYKLGELIAE